MKISWTPPADNSAPIDGYDVYIRDSTGAYLREAVYCDGFASATVRINAYCLVPMTVLLSSSYGLVRGDPVLTKVRAHNAYGDGPLSPVPVGASVLVQTPPGIVQGLTTGPSTSANQIELQWSGLTTPAETGGAPILSYHLQWDAGVLGAWQDLVGSLSDFTSLSYIVTSGVSPGSVYSFRVRAKNMWGWSRDYSATLKVTPSAKPDKMAPVEVVTDTTGAVIVRWVAPQANAAPITEYLIELLDSASGWRTVLTTCDGASPVIITALRCTIPMATFTAAPFNLARGVLIRARGSARNSNGWSTVSDTNTIGATVRTPPTFMNPPARDPASSDTQIVLTWTGIATQADTGGSPVLSYGLEGRAVGSTAWT